MGEDKSSSDEDDIEEIDYEDNSSNADDVIKECEDSNRGKRRNTNEKHDKYKSKRIKLSEGALTKPPTSSELNQLRETENLFHSNIFRLQIQEMLKEIKPKPKTKTLLGQWLSKFETFLRGLKASKKHILADLEWLQNSSVNIPLSSKFPDFLVENVSNSCCTFVPPSDVSVIGSYESDCFVGPHIKVDVKVEMPSECFSQRDELNHAYHGKRALYLCYIASKLTDLDIVETINFSQHRNPLSPILEVKPRGKLEKSVTVHIYVVAHHNSFKLVRFSPSKPKVMPKWYFNKTDKTNYSSLNSPTPHYNSSVLQDLTINANEECKKTFLSDHSNIRDGIILLKIWLRQVQLDEGYGGVSGYIMTMFVIYLLQARRLNKLMSSYQIARNVWNNLGQSDWTTKGITMVCTKLENQPSLEEFHKHFDVVFVDTSGFLNLCGEMSKETFLRLKEESLLAVKSLDNPNINSFATLFMTSKPLHLQCDHILSFQESTLTKLVRQHSPVEKQLDFGGHVYPQALSLILHSLRQGLEKRVSVIWIQHPDVTRWSVSENPPPSSTTITIGLVLNPKYAFSVLERGPEPNVKEAEDFRKYWGSKCELMRFQDGSINEVLIWTKPTSTISRKRLATQEVVKYLLETKLGIGSNKFTYLADQFEALLESPKMKPSDFEYGTGEEASLQVIKSFDSLAKELRQLTDLPLDVGTVQGSSPVFRYTDAYPPLASNSSVKGKKGYYIEEDKTCLLMKPDAFKQSTPDWVKPIEAVIQLGLSGKWPDDLGATRRIQAAFYTSIAKQLTKQFQLATQPYPGYLDVLKDGFIFRLQIGNQREATLLKKSVTPDGLIKFKDTEESLELEKQIEHRPKLTGALHGVHQQYPGFGPACCLAKRWLRCHLLDPVHFPDECIELLVAMLFLKPEPFTHPTQPQVALFRFLRMLANTNWQTECFILNLNEELTREDILEIEGTFNKNRESLPPLFIASSFDHSGSVWTKTAPTLQILIRVAQLAAESLKIINNNFFTAEQSVVNVYQLFRPDTSVYDVVIHTKNNMNARYHEAIPSADEPPTVCDSFSGAKCEKIPAVGFNPVECYINKLREVFAEFALFFYDPHGGDKIGVLWKPSTKLIKDFKVSHVNGRKLLGSTQLVTNLEAIIEDFHIMGRNLVKSVEVQNGAS